MKSITASRDRTVAAPTCCATLWGTWLERMCLGTQGPAPYQPLYPFLLLLFQRDDINFCQGSWIQTDELCRYLEVSQRDRKG